MSKKKRSSSRKKLYRNLVAIVKKAAVKLVLTDADGTMYSFWDYFVPAMQYIVPIIAQRMGWTMDQVSHALGAIMDAYGTHEHPWVVEEALRKHFDGTDEEFRSQISEPFWAAMDRYREMYLRTYPEVLETLAAVQEAGIAVAIVSDSPDHMAPVRAASDHTGVDKYIGACFALKTEEPRAGHGLSEADLALGYERVKRLSATPHHFQNGVFSMDKTTCEKPHTGSVEAAMKLFGVEDPSQVLFIGDSLKKDGGVAQKMGCRFIWARYGTYLPAGYRKCIDVHFKKPGSVPVSATIPASAEVYPPMVAAASAFSEVLLHLGKENIGTSGTILAATSLSCAMQAEGH